jgi:hypothetical protein
METTHSTGKLCRSTEPPLREISEAAYTTYHLVISQLGSVAVIKVAKR